MSSILNSISTGNLQVQNAPRESTGVNNVLKKSEIEFATCTRRKNNVLNMETGFGENGELHYETKCKKPHLKVPLYQENYLSEFKTEEEKAAARRALGLYNKEDIVAMSLLTAEDSLPSQQEILDASTKQLRKGDVFFNPVTSFNAVYDSQGVTLVSRLLEINNLITTQQNQLFKLTQPSNTKDISSLGDVKLFLSGFTNGDNLHDSLDEMNREMLRFEYTGQITT